MAQHLTNGIDEDSASEYASSTVATDPLEDFLERYTFKISPECCLKLHKRWGEARLGANCFFRIGGRQRWTFVAKPADKGGNPWLHKLAVAPAQSLVQVSTAKKHIGSWLRLQVTGEFDWETQRAGVHWKVSTKWNVGRNKLQRKEKLRLVDGVELRPHWRADMYMPEVEGRLGSAAPGEDGVRVERGHCHITIPRLDLVLPLDALAHRCRQLAAARRPAPEGDRASADAGPGTGDEKSAERLPAAESAVPAWRHAPPHAHGGGQAASGDGDQARSSQPASFQWRRKGGAVGEAVERPSEQAVEQGPPWMVLLRRLQERLPRRPALAASPGPEPGS